MPALDDRYDRTTRNGCKVDRWTAQASMPPKRSGPHSDRYPGVVVNISRRVGWHTR